MNTKITIPFSLAALLFAAVFFSCNKGQEAAVPAPYAINFIPAKTGNELIALRKGSKANLIRTLHDFDAVIASKSTPLSRLSAADVNELRNSLVVREGIGIVSLSYGTLKRHLSYDDFAAVMNTFGLDIKGGFWGLSQDPAIMAKLAIDGEDDADDTIDGDDSGGVPNSDHAGYYCMTTYLHTCKKLAENICLAGC